MNTSYSSYPVYYKSSIFNTYNNKYTKGKLKISKKGNVKFISKSGEMQLKLGTESEIISNIDSDKPVKCKICNTKSMYKLHKKYYYCIKCKNIINMKGDRNYE